MKSQGKQFTISFNGENASLDNALFFAFRKYFKTFKFTPVINSPNIHQCIAWRIDVHRMSIFSSHPIWPWSLLSSNYVFPSNFPHRIVTHATLLNRFTTTFWLFYTLNCTLRTNNPGIAFTMALLKVCKKDLRNLYLIVTVGFLFFPLLYKIIIEEEESVANFKNSRSDWSLYIETAKTTIF